MAEEDTIQRLINKETETDNIENETITKENVEAPKKFKGETDESNNVVAKSTFTSGDVEKLATGNMGINNENGTFLSTYMSIGVFVYVNLNLPITHTTSRVLNMAHAWF